MTTQRYIFLILILGSLTALGPFSIDMYLPGFPAIAKDLHTTTSRVDQSLSSFFIGLAFGQLLYGPLMDRFGRKKPLYFGLVAYIVTSVGCALCRSVDMLIWLRLLQAIGACAASVAAMAMVRDLFPVDQNAKVFALLVLVLGASPLIAPTAGGYLTDAFGWQAVFVVLLSIALLILIATIFALPESVEPDHTLSLKPGPIISNFISVIKEPQFLTYSLVGALTFAGLFAYVAGSPLVFMEIFHVSGKVYGWIFAGLSIGFIGSSQVNSLMIRKYKSEQMIRTFAVLQVIAGVVFLTASINGWYGIGGTIVNIFVMLSCVGFIAPNASALTLAPFSKNAGSASALMGAMQLGIGSFVSFLISLFSSQSTMPMAAVMAISSVLCLLVLFIGSRLIKDKVEAVAGAAVAAH